MVDFARMLADKIAAMSPEERADYETRKARREAVDATGRPIVGHFERLVRRPPAGTSVLSRLGKGPSRDDETVVESEWEKPVTLCIENLGEGPDERDVLHVRGAVTGHESFTLDQRLVDHLLDPEETARRPRFYVCAGTAGRYDACWIEIDAVLDYLREMRPNLFAAAATP